MEIKVADLTHTATQQLDVRTQHGAARLFAWQQMPSPSKRIDLSLDGLGKKC